MSIYIHTSLTRLISSCAVRYTGVDGAEQYVGVALISLEERVTKMLLSGKKIHEVAELLNYGDRPLSVRASAADSGAEPSSA